MARPGAEQWGAALHQLREAHAAGQRSTEMVRLVAGGLGVTERAVWARLAGDKRIGPRSAAEQRFRLSGTDRAAYIDFRGNVTAVHRSRAAVLAGQNAAAGIAIPAELAEGWAGAEPVSLRTVQRAFAAELTPAQAAAATGGDRARRAKLVYLRRAVDLLATRARPGGGTRLTITGDTLTLTLAPGMLDHPARRRLNQLLHAHGLGPDPHVLHLIHQLSNPYVRSCIADSAPDLITEALEYQLVDYETDPETGATELGLHPDVKFSLGLTQFRYPPEDDPGTSTTEDP